MILVASMLGAALFAIAFRTSLKRAPWVFYTLALAMVAVFAVLDSALAPRAVVVAFVVPLQRCYFAFALFAVVMFAGVLKGCSRARGYLVPIRAELSILAAILTSAHIVRYCTSYCTRLFDASSAVAANLYGAFSIAVVLVILLAALAVTSFHAVKSRMSASVWKGVQKLAYPFFALVCVHAIVALAPSAVNGSASSAMAIATYALVLGAYVILRVRRACIEGSPALRRNRNEVLLP